MNPTRTMNAIASLNESNSISRCNAPLRSVHSTFQAYGPVQLRHKPSTRAPTNYGEKVPAGHLIWCGNKPSVSAEPAHSFGPTLRATSFGIIRMSD